MIDPKRGFGRKEFFMITRLIHAATLFAAGALLVGSVSPLGAAPVAGFGAGSVSMLVASCGNDQKDEKAPDAQKGCCSKDKKKGAKCDKCGKDKKKDGCCGKDKKPEDAAPAKK